MIYDSIPGGFGLAEMNTSTQNPHNPHISTITNASENHWPVKIKHYSNAKRMWVYLHEDEPSVRAFLEETKAIEIQRKAENC